MTGHTKLMTAALVATLTASSAAAQQVRDSPVSYDTDLPTAEFHRGRRAAVMEVIPNGAVGVFVSAPERVRENDVNFEFRQSSDLLYLTGTSEPNSALLLSPDGIEVDGETVHEVLFVPDRDPSRETWTGRLYGADRAEEQLGVEMAVTNDRFEEILGGALINRRLYHLPFPSGVPEGSELAGQLGALRADGSILEPDLPGFMPFVFNRIISVTDQASYDQAKGIVSRFGLQFDGTNVEEIADAFAQSETLAGWVAWRTANVDSMYADGYTLRAALNGLRMTKSETELALMQRAIDNTTEAHREAMMAIEPGMYEYQVEALVEYVFRRNGSEYTGFPSIIGSGENSVILHYESNRRQMQDGDMVVMDVGAEYHGYSADVTRTVPVNGHFSEEQGAIYELVLRAQRAGIEATRAGNRFSDPHLAARQILLDGMKELGLVHEDNELRRFFMHGTSHYLGMYVHDVGTGGELTPGTVITVEPGIYIAAADDIDPKWWNIGVRIEDDVLVTDGDPVVMSQAAPRTVAEIEEMMAR